MYKFSFANPVEKFDYIKYYYTVVMLPPDLIPQLPLSEFPKLRIEAEVEDSFMDAAFMPSKGNWYLMVPKKVLKKINKGLGDIVNIKFNIADQDKVRIPRSLQKRLEQNPELKAAWDTLTPGRQRGIAYMIGTAKTAPTIEKRLLELEEEII